MRKIFAFFAAFCLPGLPTAAQSDDEFDIIEQSLANPDNEPMPVHPVPSDRQMEWQETEFYAFFHYGMNTYTGLEWGYGSEDENTYAPTQTPNPRQWLAAAKSAGMKGGIFVAKHHDGFCLWPTSSTTHSVLACADPVAKAVNIPDSFCTAARDLGMKYGFYVSPWDRNAASYGQSDYVYDVFLRQCTELAQYGDDQFEMWFDGANGGSGYYGGADENRTIDETTYYDAPNMRDSIHKLSPNCVLWGAVGGEARWIGNEAGWAGETNWSTYERGITSESQGMYGEEDGWAWLPGESDAKATSGGWFWHDGEYVYDLETLWSYYIKTVGRNATLILNIPPNQDGLLPDSSVARLEQFGQILEERLGTDLLQTEGVTIETSATRAAGASRTYDAANLLDNDKNTYWATDDSVTSATITIMLPARIRVHYLSLMEYIRKGQRIQDFTIETTNTGGNSWVERVADMETTTIGYKRIIPLDGDADSYGAGLQINGIRITINAAKACPLLHTIAAY